MAGEASSNISGERALLALVFLAAWALTILGWYAFVLGPLLGLVPAASLETYAYFALWVVFTLLITAGLARGAPRT